VEVIANLPAGGSVLVANHASILDGLVLAAVLPGPLVFPAAGELASARIAGPFLRRIGAVFVDRADRKEAAAASRRLLEAARQGAVLAFFPEGTMSRVPGLHPFRMGAFVVSEEAGLPLVPVALRGTGRILRGDRRFPRHGRIEVSITAPLTPTRPGWPGAVELRAAARRALLAELDEADLEV
jgi:1-acyl-sn-glycerol-3-phosphate acyltransferase